MNPDMLNRHSPTNDTLNKMAKESNLNIDGN